MPALRRPVMVVAAVAVAVALALPLAAGPALAGEWTSDKASGCRVFLRDGQTGWSAQWHGACQGGTAGGAGVLRLFRGGTFQGAFFGRMAGGYWRQGAFQTPNGWEAGTFAGDNAVQPVEDRNQLIEAFDLAAAAARALADDYARQGNAASAQHYRAVAEQLAAQMD